MSLQHLSNRELVERCCSSNDAQVWEEFLRRTRRLVMGTVRRVARKWNETRPEILDELVQETYLHIYCKDRHGLKKFNSQDDDAIFRYLKVIAANITHDHLRAQNASKRGAALTGSADAPSQTSAHPEISVAQQTERSVLLTEIEAWLDKLISGEDAKKYKTIYWLYYRQGMTAASIAQIPALGLTTKGVESVLGRLTKAIREKINPAKSEGQGA